MKKTCESCGHTFLKASDVEDSVRKHNWFKRKDKKELHPYGHDVVSILEHLVELEVLVKEDEDKYFLQRYWRAEEHCKDAIMTLIQKGKSFYHEVEVDFER